MEGCRMSQEQPPSGHGRESRAANVSADSPNVHVGRDDEGRIRVLRHPREPFSAEQAGLAEASPLERADAYVRAVLPMYDLSNEHVADLSTPVRRQPVEEGVRLKIDQEKNVLDTVVVSRSEEHTSELQSR